MLLKIYIVIFSFLRTPTQKMVLTFVKFQSFTSKLFPTQSYSTELAVGS